MENKKSGRILILRVCLFFGVGLFLGWKIGGIMRNPEGFRVFLGRIQGGFQMDVKKTLIKEFKYLIFLWITALFLKKEVLTLNVLMLKGLLTGTALRILAASGGFSFVFLYFAPMQIFSSAALILTAGSGIYNSERNMKNYSGFSLVIRGIFLMLLGLAVEFVILKII